MERSQIRVVMATGVLLCASALGAGCWSQDESKVGPGNAPADASPPLQPLEARVVKARNAWNIGKQDDAIADLTRLLEEFPDNAQVEYFLGNMLILAGNEQDGQAHVDRAEHLDAEIAHKTGAIRGLIKDKPKEVMSGGVPVPNKPPAPGVSGAAGAPNRDKTATAAPTPTAAPATPKPVR
ncbi:MAG: tetratricopeptide repeat protein [Candidatus Schekmanbacteria bacterium]|nr:tetratricopeptide repeat protein [Candidatus Schekmanbacteria bacterium]